MRTTKVNNMKLHETLKDIYDNYLPNWCDGESNRKEKIRVWNDFMQHLYKVEINYEKLGNEIKFLNTKIENMQKDNLKKLPKGILIDILNQIDNKIKEYKKGNITIDEILPQLWHEFENRYETKLQIIKKKLLKIL